MDTISPKQKVPYGRPPTHIILFFFFLAVGCAFISKTPQSPIPEDPGPTKGHTTTGGQGAPRVDYVCSNTLTAPPGTLTGMGSFNSLDGKLFFVPNTWVFNLGNLEGSLSEPQNVEDGARRGVRFVLTLASGDPNPPVHISVVMDLSGEVPLWGYESGEKGTTPLSKATTPCEKKPTSN